MKKLVFIFLLSYLSTSILEAQEFNVSFKSKQLQILAGYDLKTECIVSVSQGFSASVFLSISSPTLAINDEALKLKIVNSPFPQAVGINFKPQISDTGTHKIFLKGSNQTLISYDTLNLTIVKSDQWRSYPNPYGALTFAAQSDSVMYFTTIYRNKFLGKISNNTITYQGGWDNMPTLSNNSWHRYQMIIDNSTIWTGSSAGIGIYDDSFWTVYPFASNDAMQRLAKDSSESIWYSTDYINAPFHVSHLNKISGGKTISFENEIRAFTGQKKSFGLNGLLVDRDNNVWVIAETADWGNSASNMLLKYNGQEWSRVEYPRDTTNAQLTTFLYEMALDNQNNLWLWKSSNLETSLLKFDGQSWQEFISPVKGQPRNVAVDNNGTFWVQFYGSLTSFDGTDWKTYTSENSPIPTNFATSLTVDNHNNLWMIWDNKIIVFNPENITGMQMVLASLTDITDEIGTDTDFKNTTSPNPAQNSTTIHYSLKTESPVSISIYNSLGIEVFKNNLGFKNAGDNSEVISTSEMPSGQYYYVLKAGAQQSTQPLVIVR